MRPEAEMLVQAIQSLPYKDALRYAENFINETESRCREPKEDNCSNACGCQRRNVTETSNGTLPTSDSTLAHYEECERIRATEN